MKGALGFVVWKNRCAGDRWRSGRCWGVRKLKGRMYRGHRRQNHSIILLSLLFDCLWKNLNFCQILFSASLLRYFQTGYNNVDLPHKIWIKSDKRVNVVNFPLCDLREMALPNKKQIKRKTCLHFSINFRRNNIQSPKLLLQSVAWVHCLDYDHSNAETLWGSNWEKVPLKIKIIFKGTHL